MPAAASRPLAAAFFDRPPDQVAPELLGKLIVREDGRVARLVEVEAYAPDDPAAHTYRGETPRNRSMFGPPGRLYVYFSYGVHWCANVVCGAPGFGAGILLRAGEPLAGIELMQQARGRERLTELCSGPGRLAQAFAIDRSLDGTDVTGAGVVTIGDDGAPPPITLACARVGISKNAEAPLRFVVKGSAHLSRPPRKASPDG